MRYGLLAWTRVSADSEKCRGSQWAVKVGQRLQLRFGQSGAARELGLVQIVVQASAIRGGFPNTWPTQPVFGWRCRSVLGDYGEVLSIRTAGCQLYILETLVVMNGLLMGQLLSRQFRKSRTRAQILLRTLRSLHLATSSHL